MAVYVETVLPSGRGLRIEKLNTRQFRAAQSRCREGDSMSLATELLLTAFRGITGYALPWKEDKDGGPDVDTMLREVPSDQWILPTYEELVIAEGSRSLETLLDDPTDYVAALRLAGDVTLPNRDRAGSLMGKTRMTTT